MMNFKTMNMVQKVEFLSDVLGETIFSVNTVPYQKLTSEEQTQVKKLFFAELKSANVEVTDALTQAVKETFPTSPMANMLIEFTTSTNQSSSSIASSSTLVVRGLTELEYEAIKEAAKAELPFSINIRIHKQKYAYGAIDIRPRAPRGNRDFNYAWTEVQFSLVLNFLIKHKLVYATTLIADVKPGQNTDQFGMQYLFWKNGFTFVQLVESFVAESERIVNAYEEQINEVQPVAETVILSNKNRHYGYTPITLESLIEDLQTYALDPVFEKYGNFITEYNPKQWTDDNSKYKGYKHIFGNFFSYSNVFRILTNDEQVIDRLTVLIRQNQTMSNYHAAKLETERYEREKKERKSNYINKNNRQYVLSVV